MILSSKNSLGGFDSPVGVLRGVHRNCLTANMQPSSPLQISFPLALDLSRRRDLDWRENEKVMNDWIMRIGMNFIMRIIMGYWVDKRLVIIRDN